MGRRKRRGLPAGVEVVRQRIEHWRRTREKRTRMPEALWEAAASVAQEHGLWAVSRALRVNYESLKSRVGRTRRGASRGGGGSSRFVEVNAGQLIGLSERAGTVVELSAADGARLTVRLEGREPLDVLALADAFWERGR